MLPFHNRRRDQRKTWAVFFISSVSRSKGWQAFGGLLIVVLLLRWKASKLEGACRAYMTQTSQDLVEVQELVIKRDKVVDGLVEQIATIQIETQPCKDFKESICRPLPPNNAILQHRHRHKMAVIVPYRDRGAMLEAFLPALSTFLKAGAIPAQGLVVKYLADIEGGWVQAQGRDFGIFVIEQSPKLRFNRGLLLNAGVVLLGGSEYDYFVFHDVDTLPTEIGGIPYDYPSGEPPLHLTPPGIHPLVRYKDFFGGVTAFTRAQIAAVNGYGTQFWGWGREDDNMRDRLIAAKLWPPQRPSVPRRSSRFYFRHSLHEKAPEVRVRSWNNGSREFFEVDPDTPYEDTLIISSQPGYLDDFQSGLNVSKFWVKDLQPLQGLAVRFSLELFCDVQKTPWCQVD